jgi:hypothetical protein
MLNKRTGAGFHYFWLSPFAVCVALVMVFELLAVPNLTVIVDVLDFCAVRALSAFG